MGFSRRPMVSRGWTGRDFQGKDEMPCLETMLIGV